MRFMQKDDTYWYGPLETPEGLRRLMMSQIDEVLEQFPDTYPPKLIRNEHGLWVAHRARKNARHALAIGRGLSRPIDISPL